MDVPFVRSLHYKLWTLYYLPALQRLRLLPFIPPLTRDNTSILKFSVCLPAATGWHIYSKIFLYASFTFCPAPCALSLFQPIQPNKHNKHNELKTTAEKPWNQLAGHIASRHPGFVYRAILSGRSHNEDWSFNARTTAGQPSSHGSVANLLERKFWWH